MMSRLRPRLALLLLTNDVDSGAKSRQLTGKKAAPKGGFRYARNRV